MVSHALYRGGARAVSLGIDATFGYNPMARFYAMVATAGSLTFSLPDLDDPHVPTGQNLFVFANFGGNSFTIADSNSLGFAMAVASTKTITISSYIDESGGSPILGRNWTGWVRQALF